ncbi:DUF3147 family protein [Staphylococcus sp. SQ8-PEA]|uniref:DUF3147 family protein n=1 Tax=Staphylococcus marylandisciuri TaxID=2981529 RepID=A0ABT2QRQ6_9STAP|nr:DUF3147 family protein [Staphylococcus marylandisciuri]MCU5746669.1 DUF3147 family protein [Staphylococcus marylandisciuri]
MKSLVIKFLLGGIAVVVSYIISMVIPWKEFGGIFATFPAVYLVSMYLSGLEFGDKVAMYVSRGAVFGMMGVLANIIVTWLMLTYTGMWFISILVGFIAWFITAMIVFEIVELVARRRGGEHGRETQRSHG